MKPRTIILLVVAVVCGLAAMYMTNRLLADKAAPTPSHMVKVLVAKKKVDAYQPLKKPEELFEIKEVPEGTYSPKCITDLKQLQDKALRRPLDEQMPVVPDDLLTAETSGLIANLKDNQRAVAIKVTPESLVGGFVLPGSKVDVMFIKKRGDGDSSSQIVLQDMLVLAVDTTNTRAEEQHTILGSTATLAATPEEAGQLALAQSLGDLRLLLRSPLDKTQAKYKPITLNDLNGKPRQPKDGEAGGTDSTDGNSGTTAAVVAPLPPVKPVEPPPPVKVAEEPPPPVTHTLRIVQGDTKTKVVFVWDAKNNCWQGSDKEDKSDDAPKVKDAGKPADAPKSKDADKSNDAPKAPAADASKEGPVG